MVKIYKIKITKNKMPYKFSAHGHPNILATHKTTIEFTKDKELSKEGNCIVGVNSDFDLESLKKFINKKISLGKKSIKIIIKINDIKEEINAELNPDFDDDKEMVIRKSDFASKRTFAIRADKGAFDLAICSNLKSKDDKIIVEII